MGFAGVKKMSSMIADIQGAAVAHGRLAELDAECRANDDDGKLDLASLGSILLRVAQVLVLVRMIDMSP
jgi:hypothetical protein